MFNAKKFKQRQKQVWSAVAEVYDQSFSTLAYPAALQMILEAKLQKGDHVLDIASGTGMDAFTALPMVGKEGRIIGIDIAEQMVSVANQKVQARGIPNCEFQVMDAEELTFKSGTFDAAISKWGLMHLPDCHRALKELIRVLKPGGRVSALVLGRQENARFLTVAALAAYKVNPALIEAEDGPTAFQYGHEGALDSLFNAAGLVNVRSQRLALMITCADGEKYWDLFINGAGNFADKMRRAEPGVYASVRKAAIESAERFNSPDGIRLPFEVVVGYGEKPAKGKDSVKPPARLRSLDELAAAEQGVRGMAPKELARHLRDEQVAILDVRTKDEYVRGRVPRAHCAPRGALEHIVGGVLLPEALRQIVVYSHDGRTGRLAARALMAMGYEGVANLDGGFEAWRQNGLPVDERPPAQEPLLPHSLAAGKQGWIRSVNPRGNG